MERTINKKGMQAAIFVVAAIVITFISVMFPAAMTFGGYKGILYHGFPVGWTGETQNGIVAVANAYDSFQYFNYLTGFIVDVLFWFCIAFFIGIIPLAMQGDGRRRLR